MRRLLAAVGRGCINRSEDVRLVQALLNVHKLPMQPLLIVDGVVGSKTVAAIEAFQRRVLGMSLPTGQVEPDGPTCTALLHDPAPPDGLPASGGAAEGAHPA